MNSMNIDDVMMSLFPIDMPIKTKTKRQPEPVREHMPFMCRYTSKRCFEPRAIKRNGALHNLCDFHRVAANRNQRRFELRRRVNEMRSVPAYKAAHRRRTLDAAKLVHHHAADPSWTSNDAFLHMDSEISMSAFMTMPMDTIAWNQYQESDCSSVCGSSAASDTDSDIQSHFSTDSTPMPMTGTPDLVDLAELANSRLQAEQWTASVSFEAPEWPPLAIAL